MVANQDLQIIQEKNKSRQQGKEALVARNTSVIGDVLIDGVGVATVDIDFPARFTRLPFPSYGVSVAEGSYWQDGDPLEVTAFVSKWKTRKKGKLTIAWVGCTWVVTSFGVSGTKFLFHWRMEGMGFRNPTSSVGKVDGTL